MPLTPEALAAARSALAAAFQGGAPVEFTADGAALPRTEARDASRGGHPDAVAVVRTSGSTGTPKQTVLTRAALRASAAATAERIGAQGSWLLAVGLPYVAGLAVLSRSVQSGTAPVALDPGPFTPALFADGAARLAATAGDDARIVSLVPTQLSRLLDPSADPAGLRALRGFDAVLVGGARVPDALRAAAADAGVRLHLTYGMSETCGGCVYDGVPLPGVRADVVAPEGAGPDAVPRIRLSGPMVAAGYLDDSERTAANFGGGPTGRWYLTEDTGTVETLPDGTQRVTVTGRVDDVVNTGGVKVSAAVVQAVLEAHDDVAAAWVGGAPDAEWGQAVVAAVVPTGGPGAFTPALREELAAQVRDRLGAPAAPKRWLALEVLPLLPNGKTDRQALAARLR